MKVVINIRMSGKILFLSMGLLFFLSGCAKKERTYSSREMEHIVDSLVKERSVELKREAKEDLKLRSPIEIRQKTDSILNRPTTTTIPPIMESDSPREDNFPLDSIVPLRQ